jgi:hypothetical protein
LLLILCSLSFPGEALNGAELTTLQRLRGSFPSLQQVSVIDEFDDDTGQYGGSWVKPLEETCRGGAGWDIHGVKCSSSGNIEALRFSNGWGLNTSTIPSLSLPYLQQIILSASAKYPLLNPSGFEALMSALPLGSIRALEIQLWPASTLFPSTLLPRFTALETLSIDVPIASVLPNMSTLTNLKQAKIRTGPLRMLWPSLSSYLGGSKTSLRELYTTAMFDDLSDFAQFVGLQKFNFSGKIPSAGPPQLSPLVLPPNLVALGIVNYPSLELNLSTTTLEQLTLEFPVATAFKLPNSLRRFKVHEFSGSPWIYAFPANLESLEISGVSPVAANFIPGAFDACTNLHTLSIYNVLNPTWDNFPSLSNTVLTSLVLDKVVSSVDFPPFERIICSVPGTYLTRLSFVDSKVEALPSCMGRFQALESLQILSDNLGFKPEFLENVTTPILRTLAINTRPWGNQLPWADWVAQFPNLENFSVFPPAPTNGLFPTQELSALSKLKSLKLFGLRLQGTLPSNWLTSFPNLEILDLRNQRLSGAIPDVGWSKLREVYLTRNLFTDFPNLQWPGAPELRYLDVSYNDLRSIPHDTIFERMPWLRQLMLNDNPNLGGPAPAFWAKADSRMRTIFASNTLLSGTIPPISNSRIRIVLFSDTQLCGSLPEVTRPTVIETLRLRNNHFEGSLPASWSSSLTITLSLSVYGNLLSGALPNQILAPDSAKTLEYLELSNNYFHGPLFNLSGYRQIKELSFDGANMNLNACAANPIFQPSEAATCRFNPGFGCGCTQYWSQCLNHTVACLAPGSPSPAPSTAPAPPVAPLKYVCEEPPGRAIPPPPPPPPPSPCAGSPPNTDFECIDGAWQSEGAINLPTLTIPSGSSVVTNGSLSIGQSLTFEGIGATLYVNGCIFFDNTEILVTLSEEDLKELEQKKGEIQITILQATESGCDGSSDLASLIINAQLKSKSCKKVKAVTNEDSNRETLSVTFRLDSSKCRIWWIVLASVLGGVVLIAAVIAILAATNSNVRKFFRPHAR